MVRRKALECGLRTDSSLRFEKGIHPTFVALASERAASLYQGLCGARVSVPANAGAAVETELSIPSFDGAN